MSKPIEFQDRQAQKLLENLTPDQRGFAEHVATLQVENKAFQQQLADLKSAYEGLWKIIITIVAASPEKELRIHNSQFLRFKEEYRLDRTFDEEKEEVVIKLKTLTDE